MSFQSFNFDDIKKLANLARLEDQELANNSIAKDLSNILQRIINEINKVDTKNITPMEHPLKVGQRLRADIVTEENDRDLLMKLTDSKIANYYLVPKVVDDAE